MAKLLINDQNKVLVGSNGKAYAVGNMDALKGSSSPVNFNGTGGSVLKLMRYGKCEQDGTPTPSAPVDIVCNNGRVVAGNCISSIPDGQGTFITPSDSNMTRIYKAFPTDLVAGRSYTVTVTGATWSIIVQRKKPDVTDWSNMSAWVTTYSFVPEAGYVYGIALRIGGGTATITPADFNGTLTLDTTDGKPWAAGTPEVLTISGQNLVDLTAVDNGHYYDPSGIYTALNVARLTDYIPVRSGQKYTVYVQAEQGGSSNNVRCNLFDTEKVWKSQSVVVVTSGSANVGIVTPTEDGYLRVSANYTGSPKVDWSTLQIVFGEYTLATMPPYQPYVVAPQNASVENLLSVGDYKDEQDIISGLLTHKVGIKVLDGTEEWTANVASDAMIVEATAAWGAERGQGGYCTHLTVLKAGETTFAGACRFANDFNVYQFKTAFGVPTLDAFKALLAAQYAAGTPVIVIYPLATETTEQVTPQPLNTGAGQNILTDTAEVSNPEYNMIYKI